MYQLKTKQFLPLNINEAWDFFSSPKNLKEITPSHMGFIIKTDNGDVKTYAGQLIAYTVSPIAGIPMNWVTEITHVHEPHYFVDEQRFGPYAMWHHEHHFKEVDGGVEMSDIISYVIPFGIIGQLANWLFVGRQVRQIFDYRYQKLEELFRDKKIKTSQQAVLI